MDSFATTVSVALQYGVPLRDLVNKFAHVRFEPSGFTGNSEIPIAKSIVDYIFRWLGSRFLSDEDKATLGLIDRSALVDAPGSPVSGPVGLAEPTGGSAANSTLAGRTADPARPTVDPVAPPPADREDQPKATASTVAEASVPAPGVGEAAPRVERVELGYLATVGASNGHANGHSNGHANGSAKPANGGGVSLNLGGTKVAFATQADAPSCMDCGSIMVRNGSCYKCLNCGSTSGCS
jgi:ribonucleoside-diphosphate reductase alpha chain